MDFLKLSLKAKVPFIHIKTDDILYVQKILSFISEEQVVPFPASDEPAKADLTSGAIFFTSSDVAPQKLYLRLKAEGKTLVYVNTKTSVLHHICGTMLPPKEMIRDELKTHCEESVADEILPAFGGMTIKDTYEVVKLVLEKEGTLTPKGVNKVRQSYVAKLKGISQVDADYDFYQEPSYLKSWLDGNLDLFVNPIHESLTPRGLLFDGPPGTGKTLGAKHIASLIGVPLYRLDIGAMKGKYVGDSEGNLNAALTQIDQAAPCVVIFDEVEKIFQTGTSDGGVTSSMLSTILWWLQEHKSKVFTVMTTNSAKTIPKELYREGRIDQTLVFQGLENVASAFDFSLQVIAHLTKAPTIGQLTSNEMKSVRMSLQDRLQAEFSEGVAVPQVRVTRLANEEIKRIMVARKAKK